MYIHGPRKAAKHLSVKKAAYLWEIRDIVCKKKVFAIFLNGFISKKKSSKIFQEKVIVIIFCFIVIYQLNIDMRSTRHENIDFSFLCKKMKNPFF